MKATLLKNKKTILTLLIIILLPISFFSNALEKDKKIYATIKEHHLDSFTVKITNKELIESIDPESGDFSYERLSEIIDKRFTIPRKKMEIALNLFELIGEKEADKNKQKMLCETSDKLIETIEILKGQHTPSSHLLAKIQNNTQSTVGSVVLAKMLLQPTTNVKELKRRQNIIRELASNGIIFKDLSEAIDKYKSVEAELLKFWDEKDFSKLFSPDFYFPFFPLNIIAEILPKELSNNLFPQSTNNWFNSGRIKMETLTLWNNFTSIHYTYRALKSIFKRQLPLIKQEFLEKNYLDSGWMLGVTISTAANIYNSLKYEYKKLKMLKVAHAKLKKATSSIKSLLSVKNVINKSSALTENLRCFDNIEYLFNETSSKVKDFDQLLKNLKSSTFKERDSAIIELIVSRGKILSTAYLMSKTHYKLVEFLKALGQIDAYLAISELYKTSVEKNATYCFPEYLEQKKPYIYLEDFWTPFLNQETAVTNSIELGKENSKRNAIISGPNAGGKSTILKSIIINSWMAQTIGISPSKKNILTPFSYIDAYLNIVDDISGGNSLFKAEALRTKSLIEKISQGQKSLAIIDEMYSGTNPLEGEAASFAVAKHLASYENSIVLIASHYPKMTTLPEETSGIFKNYKITVNKNKNNKSLNYPFKLLEGKTTPEESVAIDILESEDFPKEIIDNARKIVANF